MKLRPQHCLDFYKTGHRPQYLPGTSLIYSNMTARSFDRFPIPEWDQMLNFGLSGVIKWMIIDLWNDNFFKKPLEEVLSEYKHRMDSALGEGVVTVDHIKELHELGFLPICIKALPEGVLVNKKVPFFTIYNTRPQFFWLTNYLETQLSAEVWKRTTAATIAFAFRELFSLMAKVTGSPLDFTKWQGHDFSMRGLSNVIDAAWGVGPAHLASFLGTDTVPALDYLEDLYKGKETYLGGSVAATEHSVASQNILYIKRELERKGEWNGQKYEDQPFIDLMAVAERLFLKRYITEVVPKGVASYVADTFHFWRLLTVIVPTLKDEIRSRQKDANGFAKVVFRPDSGNPVLILCGTARQISSLTWEGLKELGDLTKMGNVLNVSQQVVRCQGKFYKVEMTPGEPTFTEVIATPEQKGAVECLWDIFGGTTTETGHRVLEQCVGLIYGDSISYQRAAEILGLLAEQGFASCNVVFGIGSYTYQYVTRDSTGNAIKSTYTEINGEGLDLLKDPATDDGTKRSASGLLRVELDAESGEYVTFENQTWEQEAEGELLPYLIDGQLFPAADVGIASIRERIDALIQESLDLFEQETKAPTSEKLAEIKALFEAAPQASGADIPPVGFLPDSLTTTLVGASDSEGGDPA